MDRIWTFILNKWGLRQDRWHPLMAFYYLTTSCDFACPYCPTGPFLMDGTAPLPGAEAMELIRTLRRITGYVVITGGEPLTHPDIDYILDHVEDERFHAVILATNGHRLRQHLEPIRRHVDHLVVSLDTLESRMADRLSGTCHGALQNVMDGLEQLAIQPCSPDGHRCHVSISAVITPENIPDLYEVYRFTQSRGFEFSASPQLVGARVSSDLAESAAYRAFYDFLIREKEKGGAVYGSRRYLECMRDLKDFQCHPLTALAVSPQGDVYHPCLEGGRLIGNLRTGADLNALHRSAMGDPAECQGRCHSACMVAISMLLHHPIEFMVDAWRNVRLTSRATLDPSTEVMHDP